ncbi:MAG: eukaryotic-like serine/threonine-protein kinase [Solirubrobacteraceae bacterium]|nr:eukaryotic-like serine/threonine-protein kinase [Solirubrobacteraceae bacterium]
MTAQQIAGRYRLEGRLGSGGMSTVHLAFDTRLERHVAVKLLAEHLAEDPTFVSRFQREAMAAARLIHPNIVQVFDSGLDQRSGQHFIVMEYIEGQSCAEILRDRGWLGVDEALPIILGSCEGLDYAHRKGVVHRDVKPGNLLRANDGAVKLADFGIAKATEQASITQAGSVLGTAAYLAPEQGRGENAGPAADIYALGVVTYQLLAGRLPYEGASLTELALKQQQGRPTRLDRLVAGVTPELAEAVEIALRLDPDTRYARATDMARAIEDGVNGTATHLDVEPKTSIGAGAPTTALPREETSATRIAPSAAARRQTSAAPRQSRQSAGAAPRQPRQGPPRIARPVAAAPPPRRQPRAGRLLVLLVAIALIGGILFGVVLSGGHPKTAIRIHNIATHDVPTIVRDLNNLVTQNTG